MNNLNTFSKLYLISLCINHIFFITNFQVNYLNYYYFIGGFLMSDLEYLKIIEALEYRINYIIEIKVKAIIDQQLYNNKMAEKEG